MNDTSNAKEVATRKSAGLPSASLFEADADKGFENVKTEWNQFLKLMPAKVCQIKLSN